MEPTRYRIVVAGGLSERSAPLFDGMEVEDRGATTVLSGVVADQAQLHGVLERLRDLRIDLVSVNALD